MRQLIFSIFHIGIVAGVASFLFPWWSIAVIAFIVCLTRKLKPSKAFAAGFFGIFLCWICMALFRDFQNEHILSARMAVLFKLPHYSLYILVAAIIGGLVGGLAGWSAGLVAGINKKEV